MRAGGRIGDLKAFGGLARRPVAVDIGELAQQPAVGEAVERLVAVRAGEMRGHGRASRFGLMPEDYPLHAQTERLFGGRVE